jgi:CheY-like chemotaxis protein
MSSIRSDSKSNSISGRVQLRPLQSVNAIDSHSGSVQVLDAVGARPTDIAAQVSPPPLLVTKGQDEGKPAVSAVEASPTTTKEEEINEPGYDSKWFAGQSILMVDDVAMVRKMCSRVLKGVFGHIDEAKDGAESIEKVKRRMSPSIEEKDRHAASAAAAAVKNYDVIMMDLLMPVMNGLDATRGIRDLGYQGSAVCTLCCISLLLYERLCQ